MAELIPIAILGGIGSTVGAVQQQQSINEQACSYFDAMNDYKAVSESLLGQNRMIIGQYQSAIFDINDKIADLMNNLRTSRVQFKNTYNLHVVILTVFIVLVIFILVTKKIIYHAHTE